MLEDTSKRRPTEERWLGLIVWWNFNASLKCARGGGGVLSRFGRRRTNRINGAPPGEKEPGKPAVKWPSIPLAQLHSQWALENEKGDRPGRCVRYANRRAAIWLLNGESRQPFILHLSSYKGLRLYLIWCGRTSLLYSWLRAAIIYTPECDDFCANLIRGKVPIFGNPIFCIFLLTKMLFFIVII